MKKAGEIFELAGLKWTVLEVTEQGYKCLAEKLEGFMKFDQEGNDWKKSSLRKYLNEEFLKLLEAEIGVDNIIAFERNLLSLDGQTEYSTCEDKVSLLNFDEYRRYRGNIRNVEDYDYWWWLLTPWSTPCNNWKYSVIVVSPSGGIYDNGCNSNCCVRPFCIFSPAIFESEDE